MVESSETQSGIILSEEKDSTGEKNLNTAKDGFNLNILLKSIELYDFDENVPRVFNIHLLLGNADPIEISGTVADINKHRNCYGIRYAKIN